MKASTAARRCSGLYAPRCGPCALRAFGRAPSPASPSDFWRRRHVHRLAVVIPCCAQKSTMVAPLDAYAASSACFCAGG
jgi:hypothetical protein